MSKYFVISYSCLGDMISLSPIAHYLLDKKKATHVIFLCTERNYKTALHLFQDYPQITPYPVASDYDFYLQKVKFSSLPVEKREGYELIACGNFGDNPHFQSLDPLDVNCLYLQHGIPKETRLTHFRIPKDLSESERKYNALTSRIGKEYVLIHDDPARILLLNYEKVVQWLKENNMLHLPVIYLGKNRYNYKLIDTLNTPAVADILETEDALDYVHILRNAKACHMMDSCFAILLDYVADDSQNQKRVGYNRQPKYDTRLLYKKSWEIISQDSMINEYDPPYRGGKS